MIRNARCMARCNVQLLKGLEAKFGPQQKLHAIIDGIDCLMFAASEHQRCKATGIVDVKQLLVIFNITSGLSKKLPVLIRPLLKVVVSVRVCSY